MYELKNRVNKHKLSVCFDSVPGRDQGTEKMIQIHLLKVFFFA